MEGGGKGRYLLVFVERVDDDAHQSVHFGLEGVFCRLLSQLLHLRHTQPVQLDRFLLSALQIRVMFSL